jgi:hypothetical protein
MGEIDKSEEHVYLEWVGGLPASNSAFDMSEDKIHARQGG